MTREMTTDYYPMNLHYTGGGDHWEGDQPTYSYPQFGGWFAKNEAYGYGNDNLIGMPEDAAELMLERSVLGHGSDSQPFYNFEPFSKIETFYPKQGWYNPIHGRIEPYSQTSNDTIKTFVDFGASTYNPGFAGYGQGVSCRAAPIHSVMNIPALGRLSDALRIYAEAAAMELADRLVLPDLPGWYVAEIRWAHEFTKTNHLGVVTYYPAGKVVGLKVWFRATPDIDRYSVFTLYGRPWWTQPGDYAFRHGYVGQGEADCKELAAFSFSPGETAKEAIVELPAAHLPPGWDDEIDPEDLRRVYLLEFIHAGIPDGVDGTMRFKPHYPSNEGWFDGCEMDIFYWEITYKIPDVKFVLRNDFEEQDIDGAIDRNGRQFRRPRI